jgi:Cys-tRNA(Pro)/Cys-tRNA(Cys) deacylase
MAGHERPQKARELAAGSRDVDAISAELLSRVEGSGVPFTLHEHAPARTVADAEQNLSFGAGRIVKTVAFRIRNGGLVLAALRGAKRVDYSRLAPLVGVNRRDLKPLSPEEVREFLGVEPGSVSPVMSPDGATLCIDDDVLTIQPTIYCGIGRSDRTLEITANDLVRLADGRIGGFSR